MPKLYVLVLSLMIAGCDSADDQSSVCQTNCDGASGPITVDAGQDIRGFELDTIVLTGSARHSGNAALRFQWSQIDGPQVTLESADTPVTSFIAPVLAMQFEPLAFRLTVSASDGSVGSDTVVVELEQAVATAPEVEFNDTPESAMALTFSKTDAPALAASNVSGEIGFHPLAADLADVFVFSPPLSGVYEFRLRGRKQPGRPAGTTPYLQLTLNDQDNTVLAWSGNEFTQSPSFSIALFAGLPYYAIVQSPGEPADRSEYVLSIISHR